MLIIAIYGAADRAIMVQSAESSSYFLYFFSHSTKLTTHDGTTCDIPSGSLMLCSAANVCQCDKLSDADFTAVLSDAVISYDIAQQIPLTPAADELADTDAICKLLLHFSGKQPHDAYAAEAAEHLMQVLLLQCRHLTLAKTKLSAPDCNTAALVTLREELYRTPERRWSIEQMCERVNLSRAHLHRVYSETFGCSCYRDVMESRLQYACRLLQSTECPICEIAQQCGFESDTSFIRAFKKQLHATPTAYRRAFQSE